MEFCTFLNPKHKIKNAKELNLPRAGWNSPGLRFWVNKETHNKMEKANYKEYNSYKKKEKLGTQGELVEKRNQIEENAKGEKRRKFEFEDEYGMNCDLKSFRSGGGNGRTESFGKIKVEMNDNMSGSEKRSSFKHGRTNLGEGKQLMRNLSEMDELSFIREERLMKKKRELIKDYTLFKEFATKSPKRIKKPEYSEELKQKMKNKKQKREGIFQK